MAELRLTKQAHTIRGSGIERLGEEASERHLWAVRQTFELLSKYSLAGQERPEFRGGPRSISRRPHRIRYAVRGTVVPVGRVIHQMRDIAIALDDDT